MDNSLVKEMFMYKKFGVIFLIFCFCFSSVNVSLAYQVIEVPPVIVQPYDLNTLNLQMFAMDRENQEKALAINALMHENQKFAHTALAQQQNTTLENINKTIINSQAVTNYDELINLTVFVDNMKSFGKTAVLKMDAIQEKYKILTDLEDEMVVLNKNLNKVDHQQDGKIQLLTQRLGEMDQKIAHYNDILADKDQQIAQLKDNLASVQGEAITKDELIKKQKSQLELLKSELENKITESNKQTGSIHWLNQVLSVTKNKAEYYKLTSQKDRLTMQQFQKELQDVKDDFARHSKDYDNLENVIADYKSQVSQLGLQLSQKQGEVDLLKLELKNKIAQSNDQGVLTDQIQDLKAQLQDKEDQIGIMKTKIQSGQGTKQEVDSLNQQLLAQQDKVAQLKQQLEIETAQSDQMSLMVDEYQKKLESKNNANNEQLGLLTASKNDKAEMEKQVADLNTRLQEKESQLVKIKKDMYDLQELNRSSQTKDLNSSLTQQMTMDKKIKEYQEKIDGLQATSAKQIGEITRLKTKLALRRPGPNNAPNSDELNFLRTAYKQVSAELEQKDKLYRESKANADEYEKEFKDQSREFRRLKDQLQDAREEIKRKDEDLRYKGLEVIRNKRLNGNTHGNKVEALQEQLKKANLEIKDLQAQLNQIKSISNQDTRTEKLTQAMVKINEQGRAINLLSQKLQACGQSADLTKESPSNSPGVQKLF